MAGISKRQRAQRTRRANERRALNPCTIKRQLLRAQRERLRNRTFNPFLRLPAELKLRVLELADLDSIRNLAGTCRTMASLWAANSDAIWNVLLQERFRLESRVIGPAESFPSFRESTGPTARSLRCQRTPEQEAAIENAAQAVVMRRGTDWLQGGGLCDAPMTELSVRARRGGFGYLKLLEEIGRYVDEDKEYVRADLASGGVTDMEGFRSAALLLWRLRWWRVVRVLNPAARNTLRTRYPVPDDDERIKLVADEPAESKERFQLFLRILAWRLGSYFSVDGICESAVIEERRLEEEDGRDRQIPQLHALLRTEMEGWLMREVIEKGVTQIRYPPANVQVAGRAFCSRKVDFLRHSDLREMITERGVWKERLTDLVSRMKEILGSTKLDSLGW